ncbi:3-dehydroquinate synthase [Trichinella spiralis]|uniref:3-dehydroquinate synthase n=1 Tax=Trichinella spiralis TaxID=6334 RepID=A0ABR3KAW3_TRISP
MAKDDSISQSNSDITLRLQIILSRQVHNGMIVAKSCCFTFQRISALATNCQGSLKLVYDSSRQMSLVDGEETTGSNQTCGWDIQIIPSEGPKRSFRTNSSPVQITPVVVSGSGRLICHMAIIIMHRNRKSCCGIVGRKLLRR